jgi:hypothetical protein
VSEVELPQPTATAVRSEATARAVTERRIRCSPFSTGAKPSAPLPHLATRPGPDVNAKHPRPRPPRPPAQPPL